MNSSENNQEVRPSSNGLPNKNVVLVGVTGSGKTTVGWLVARLIGFGFIDVDQVVEKKLRKSIADVFAGPGEAEFRQHERAVIQSLNGIRNHVIAVGGGAVVDEENWQDLQRLGVTVWLHTPAEEVARRLVMRPDEIRQRPLLQDLINVTDRSQRQKQLTDRLAALASQRKERYQESQFVLKDAYSTPETSAYLLKSLLFSEGVLK